MPDRQIVNRHRWACKVFLEHEEHLIIGYFDENVSFVTPSSHLLCVRKFSGALFRFLLTLVSACYKHQSEVGILCSNELLILSLLCLLYIWKLCSVHDRCVRCAVFRVMMMMMLMFWVYQ
jgi:hypothetical protein